jgi:hypothetical protein
LAAFLLAAFLLAAFLLAAYWNNRHLKDLQLICPLSLMGREKLPLHPHCVGGAISVELVQPR